METTIQNGKQADLCRRNSILFLNDQLRIHGIGGKIMLTHGISSLEEGRVGEIIQAMRGYTAWDKSNDPYGEHDFGIIKLAEPEQTVYFKIDYYDERMEFGSEDPADPEKTTRVLTLMLAEEY